MIYPPDDILKNYIQTVRDAYKHPAHHREDLTIQRLIGDKENGFYIDIGAHDPYRNSNSQPFYEKGWRGIDVEPSKYFADKLKFFHQDNIVIEAAVGDSLGSVEFHIPDVAPMHWQIATTKSLWVEHHKQRVPGEQWKTITVKQITINSIFEDYVKDNDVDFISIDVEGAELEALSGWSVDKYFTKVICIESVVDAETPRWDKWEHKLLPFYDFVHFDSSNRFYVRKG